MYSKYLDYTDAAIKATHLAQAQNEQKNIIIGHLKTDLYELRQIEGDYYKLNELILALEQKYSLLLDEKDRCEKEQRAKSDIDKHSILSLKEEIDLLRVNLQKACMQIEDLIRENTLKKRMNDGRVSEIQAVGMEIKGLDNNNQRTAEDNRSLAMTAKALKDERKRLEEECDGLSAQLDGNVVKLKTLQKAVRNGESINARLDKTLHLAQNDNEKLLADLKAKNEEAKRGEGKLRTVGNQLNEMTLNYNNTMAQADKFKAESGSNSAALNNEVAKGKDISGRLAETEAGIRAQEGQLDQIINEEEKQRKVHFMGLDDNKQLNGELDRMLALIAEFELINKELVDEIEIYSDQDEQAIEILSRRQQMKELLSANGRKLAATAEHIQQIKY